jgi:hypothetical protein
MRLVFSLLLGAATLSAACSEHTPQPDAQPAAEAAPQNATRSVSVATAAQLQAALNDAQPGDVITMADATYTGQFTIPKGKSGTSASHIVLKGSRAAILQTNNRTSGNAALFLLGNDYWEFRGFTVYNSKKGIMTDYSSYNLFDNLNVHVIGEEGVHFRRNSTHNVLQNSAIQSTGLVTPGYGEGVYIGSAESNWSTYTGGQPDLCDYNTVQNNVFGDNVKAENIDVKEGTTGGTITGNTFNGKGLDGANYADSWMDVKGNNYTISGNTGTNGGTVLLDGYQTHEAVVGWGRNNTFANNTCDVQSAGYGFNIQLRSGSALGNVVYASNTVRGAAKGNANITVTP